MTVSIPRAAVALVAGGALLAIAGCGGSPGPATTGEDAEKGASDGAIAYQRALADGDYEEVCALQTKAKLKEKVAESRKGGDPREICAAYYEKRPELSEGAAKAFSVTAVKLTPREVPLADVTVQTDGNSAVVPMVGHQDEWRVDGESGAPGFTGTGGDAPEDPDRENAAARTYSDFRKALAEREYLDACDLLTKRYRLIRAKSLDKAGVVGELCARSYEKDPSEARDASNPFDVSGVDLKVLTIPQATLDVKLGGLEGVWYMRYEDGAWRFGGGGLVDPNAGGSSSTTETTETTEGETS